MHAQVIMTDAEYYRRIRTDVRELSQLRDIDSMRLWLASRGNPASEDAGHLVFAHILGILQAKSAELVAWADRIAGDYRG